MPALDGLLVRRSVADGIRTDTWRAFAKQYIRQGIGMPRNVAMPEGGPDWMSGTERALTKGVASMVQMAETFYVTPEMAAVVGARADAWPDGEEYRADDIPSTAGFMYVPASVRDIGSDGHEIVVQVLCWHRVGDRLRLAFFYPKAATDLVIERDTAWYRALPEYLLVQMYDLPAAGSGIPLALRPGLPLPEEMRRELNILLVDDDYTVQASPRAKRWLAEQGADVDLVPDRLVVWLFSCLRLMREELPSVERVGSPANLRRGMVQRKLRNLHVTVIEHRRRASGAEQGGSYEYSHRFYRRGHNRRVWARNPETGEMEQRTVWIKPTIVNSARTDLPLLLRDHVNALSR